MRSSARQRLLRGNRRSAVRIAVGVFLAAVVGSCGGSDSKGLTVPVSALRVLEITTTTLPAAIVNRSYSALLTASDPLAQFSVSPGGLPFGLVLSVGGAISGTTNSTGTHTFKIRASAGEKTAETSLTILVIDESVSSSCAVTYAVAATGSTVTINAQNTSAQTMCLWVPAGNTGRTLVAAASTAHLTAMGYDHNRTREDKGSATFAYTVEDGRQYAALTTPLSPLSLPAKRAAQLLPRITVPGAPSPLPAVKDWRNPWENKVYRTRLAYRGTHVAYYEEMGLATPSTEAQYREIDAGVTKWWPALDTLFGPPVDLNRDGYFSMVALSQYGNSAFYSVCALAPGVDSAAGAQAGDCGSNQADDHAFMRVPSNFLGDGSLAEYAYTVLHEIVHSRQHMLTLQAAGRGASECALVPYFRARPTTPRCNPPELLSSRMWREGTANSVLLFTGASLYGSSFWLQNCYKKALDGNCGVEEPTPAYNNGPMFWTWLADRFGRDTQSRALVHALSVSAREDALKAVLGTDESVLWTSFALALMLDETDRGSALRLDWPDRNVPKLLGFSSASSQFSGQVTVGVGATDATSVVWGAPQVLAVNNATSVLLKFRLLPGRHGLTVTIVPEVP